jgi:lysyl-tRNA synthetase class 2
MDNMPKSKNARLINNDKLKKNTALRANIVNLIRDFFNERSFLEVNTPLIDLCPSMEPAISSFQTEYFDGERAHKMYLQSSPEYNMKKLIAAGYDNIFQMTKSFRNSELTRLHNPEFTILEWYRANCDYTKIMDDVEELISFICDGLGLNGKVEYLNKKVDLSPPYDKLSVKEAFKKFSDIDLDSVYPEDYDGILSEKGLKVEKDGVDFNTFFYYIFVNEIEPHLGVGIPVFLIDFPEKLGSLARHKLADEAYVERFELYIGGLEMCNAFSELTDHDEQKKRFLKEKKKRVDDDLGDYPIDNDFLSFLKYGMPPAAGIALGVDRLIMFFADTDDISDVILFPFSMMKDYKENV